MIFHDSRTAQSPKRLTNNVQQHEEHVKLEKQERKPAKPRKTTPLTCE